MKLSDLWTMIALVILSSGGIGGILIAVVKFSGNFLAERLSQKYDLKLQKEMEKYKDLLDKSNYVSKVKFDLEIEIYKELCASLFTMLENVLVLHPDWIDNSPQDEKERENFFTDRYNAACLEYNKYCERLSRNTAFIPGDIYDRFHEIQTLCKNQIISFNLKDNIEGSLNIEKEIVCFETNKEIDSKRKILIADLRAYLNHLEILAN